MVQYKWLAFPLVDGRLLFEDWCLLGRTSGGGSNSFDMSKLDCARIKIETNEVCPISDPVMSLR